MLNGSLNVAASLQTTEPAVLKNIQRANISLEALNVMAKQKRKLFGDQLRELVETDPMSRYELSKRTGVPESVLSYFVSGQRGMSLASIDAVCRCLGLRLVKHKKSVEKKGK